MSAVASTEEVKPYSHTIVRDIAISYKQNQSHTGFLLIAFREGLRHLPKSLLEDVVELMREVSDLPKEKKPMMLDLQRDLLPQIHFIAYAGRHSSCAKILRVLNDIR